MKQQACFLHLQSSQTQRKACEKQLAIDAFRPPRSDYHRLSGPLDRTPTSIDRYHLLFEKQMANYHLSGSLVPSLACEHHPDVLFRLESIPTGTTLSNRQSCR